MPISIHEIARKLQCEAGFVLLVAQEHGLKHITSLTAEVDKITGEYLREHCRARMVDLAAEPAGPRVDGGPGTKSAPRATGFFTSAPASSRAAAAGSGGREGAPVQLETEAKRFERVVRQGIEAHFPFSTLSNVQLFHPARARFDADPESGSTRNDYAVEIDHLLHRKVVGTDVLLLIECKNQPVIAKDDAMWQVRYPGKFLRRPTKVSNVQHQLIRQAEAVRAYVNPASRERPLRIEACVVSREKSVPNRTLQVNAWLTLHLMSLESLRRALEVLTPPPLRVVQSDLLGLLRLGIPVAELGHPELGNAVAYIERCRQTLDVELFRAFAPTNERWAINGSAGMGKSVLLAYSLFVLTTDRKVAVQEEQKRLVDFSAEAAELSLPPLGERGVYAFALKEKQRQLIETLYRRFVEEFGQLAGAADLNVRRPTIRLWNGRIPADCQVLVVDEAHDLTPAHAERISEWMGAAGKQRYLLVACDRHQKLRLVGREESIIEGISFRLKTKKLRLNYRNPFAVYAASLGLMFRWFAAGGPKVLPAREDLELGFGFTVAGGGSRGAVALSMRNDAHPANNWSDGVGIFPDCAAALARLRPGRFRSQDVLWVRFTEEDEHFDYEQLSCFTYHNLFSPESIELTDKYIKGQDFPVVVIEGFPEDMDNWRTPEAEQRMWQRRRELYICSSRATAFLFFVCRDAPENGRPMREEVRELVRQLATPTREPASQAQAWRFEISPTSERRRMETFTDAREPAE